MNQAKKVTLKKNKLLEARNASGHTLASMMAAYREWQQNSDHPGPEVKVYERIIMNMEKGKPVRLDQAEAVVKILGYEQIPPDWILSPETVKGIPGLSKEEEEKFWIVPETGLLDLRLVVESCTKHKFDYRSVIPEDKAQCLTVGKFITSKCVFESKDDDTLSVKFSAAAASEKMQRELDAQGLSIFARIFPSEGDTSIYIVITRTEKDPMIRIDEGKRVLLILNQGFNPEKWMGFGPPKDRHSQLEEALEETEVLVKQVSDLKEELEELKDRFDNQGLALEQSASRLQSIVEQRDERIETLRKYLKLDSEVRNEPYRLEWAREVLEADWEAVDYYYPDDRIKDGMDDYDPRDDYDPKDDYDPRED
jgi:hypothetical protein